MVPANARASPVRMPDSRLSATCACQRVPHQLLTQPTRPPGPAVHPVTEPVIHRLPQRVPARRPHPGRPVPGAAPGACAGPPAWSWRGPYALTASRPGRTPGPPEPDLHSPHTGATIKRPSPRRTEKSACHRAPCRYDCDPRRIGSWPLSAGASWSVLTLRDTLDSTSAAGCPWAHSFRVVSCVL